VRIVEKILKRLPAELRPFLFHVHFDSCESLKGVKESLPGVTISGFNAEVDINASAMLYQNYIAAAVQRVIARPDGEVVDCAKLVADELIRQARLLSSLQAQAASDDSLADVSSAFMVLYPKIPLVSTTQQSNTPLSHESAYHKFINCDGSCKKNTVIRGVRFAHLTNDDDRCSRCFAALDESEQGKYFRLEQPQSDTNGGDVGVSVLIRGVQKRPELNDCTAQIDRWDPERKRYQVTLNDGRQFSFKARNLMKLDDSKAPSAPVVGPSLRSSEQRVAPSPDPPSSNEGCLSPVTGGDGVRQVAADLPSPSAMQPLDSSDSASTEQVLSSSRAASEQAVQRFVTGTMCDRGENEKGMEMLGELAEAGISVSDLRAINQRLVSNGSMAQLIELHHPDVCGIHGAELPEAAVLVLRNGVDALAGDGAADEMDHVLWTMPIDTRSLFGMGKRRAVMNKIARHNNCMLDYDRVATEEDYEQGRGSVVNIERFPVVNALRNASQELIGHPLHCIEHNYYYKVGKQNGIGWHGDEERMIVVMYRIGHASAQSPLRFQWFYNTKTQGNEIEIPLEHGDMLIMSEWAVGRDWVTAPLKRYTLRHATGGIPSAMKRSEGATHVVPIKRTAAPPIANSITTGD